MTKFAILQTIRTKAQASFPYLVEISINNKTFYLSNSDYDIEYNDKTYSGCWFTIVKPEKSFGSVSDTSITISDLSKQFVNEIRNNGQKKSKIKFIATMLYEDSDEEIVVEPLEELEFTLTNCSWGRKTVKWSMIFDELMQDYVPPVTCDAYICPALV